MKQKFLITFLILISFIIGVFSTYFYMDHVYNYEMKKNAHEEIRSDFRQRWREIGRLEAFLEKVAERAKKEVGNVRYTEKEKLLLQNLDTIYGNPPLRYDYSPQKVSNVGILSEFNISWNEQFHHIINKFEDIETEEELVEALSRLKSFRENFDDSYNFYRDEEDGISKVDLDEDIILELNKFHSFRLMNLIN